MHWRAVAVTALLMMQAPVSLHASHHLRPFPADTPARVEVLRHPERLLVGQRVQLVARALGKDGAVVNEWIAWRASSSSYVSLASDGRITGVRPGKLTIMAVASGVIGSFPLEVVANNVASMALTPAYSIARVGDAVRITLAVRDSANTPVTGILAEWSIARAGSTGVAGAIIDDTGTFIAEQAGLFTIVATVGDRKAVATVRVAPR
jgi:hypothetical protein